ncbi:MAG: hypothetical protein B7Z15_08285 [Rhizobiales bacterium 32-66-8]|nr:MAG: hypothetical protein B7Z15_08285 [Rhizobiales bacterium 32-66-8]
MSFASGLYSGTVLHTRVKPRVHKLRYRVFWTVLDLDELEAVDAGLRLFSRNRFNLLSFHDRDHGDGSQTPLRTQVEQHLAQAGIALEGGKIQLLCMPRVLGYVFNPISVYFCHRRDGALAAVLYEVTNTFGERHSYLIPVSPEEAARGAPLRQSCDKALYVSPFIGMDIRYDFRVVDPGAMVSLVVRASDPDGLLISASMVGKRAPLTDRAIAHATLTHPLLTLKVMAGIHWEALWIFLKGIGLTRRPEAPRWPVTIVQKKPA